VVVPAGGWDPTTIELPVPKTAPPASVPEMSGPVLKFKAPKFWPCESPIPARGDLVRVRVEAPVVIIPLVFRN